MFVASENFTSFEYRPAGITISIYPHDDAWMVRVSTPTDGDELEFDFVPVANEAEARAQANRFWVLARDLHNGRLAEQRTRHNRVRMNERVILVHTNGNAYEGTVSRIGDSFVAIKDVKRSNDKGVGFNERTWNELSHAYISIPRVSIASVTWVH